jgi:hypothetical protein
MKNVSIKTASIVVNGTVVGTIASLEVNGRPVALHTTGRVTEILAAAVERARDRAAIVVDGVAVEA